LDAAEATYLKELETPASKECAEAGLTKLGQRAESCAPAQALEAVGEQQEAHAAYLKVLAADPSSACAMSGAERTRASQSVWSWLGGAAESAGKLLAALVLALLSAGIVVLLWLQVQTRWKVWPGLRNRWPASVVRRPTLQVAQFDDGALKERLGPPVAGLIRGRITWRRRDRLGLDLVSGQAGIASALDSLGDISSETKGALAVVKLLDAMLPRRRFVLAGELQPAGAEGPGISLELTREEGFDSLVSFWANPLGLAGAVETEAYQHLAIVAAAWVDHRMASAIDGENLLTGDPKSWAFFSSGVEWQRQGKNDLARMLYEQALIMDGGNVGALANLGILERVANRFDEAQSLLLRALAPTEDQTRPPKLEPAANPDWYRIKYQLAALAANRAAATNDPVELKRTLEQDAAQQAKDLALKTSQTIQDLSEQDPESMLIRFLRGTIEPDALVLAASTIPHSANAAMPEGRPSRGDILAALRQDAIDPWILIAFVERGSTRATNTLYNLGCFYASIGDFNRAAARVITAVCETQRSERQALAAVATLDPILEGLRERLPAFIPKLEALAATSPKAEDASRVAEFDRERQVMDWLESQGWKMNWAEVKSGFDLIGEGSNEVLAVVVKETPPSIEDLDTLSGAMSRFAREHPNAPSIRGMLITPQERLPPENSSAEVVDALARAPGAAVEIYGVTARGFLWASNPSEPAPAS